MQGFAAMRGGAERPQLRHDSVGAWCSSATPPHLCFDDELCSMPHIGFALFLLPSPFQRCLLLGHRRVGLSKMPPHTAAAAAATAAATARRRLSLASKRCNP